MSKYNNDLKSHSQKEKLNRYLISNYLKGQKANRAILMPSTTWQVEKLLANYNIIDSNSTFLFFEHGRNINMDLNMFKFNCQQKFQEVFRIKTDKKIKYDNINSKDGIYWGYLHNEDFNISLNRGNDELFDFAYYDTCSTVQKLPLWLPNHLNSFKANAHIIFTFDLDQTNRHIKRNIEIYKNNNFNIFNNKNITFKHFGNFNNISNTRELTTKTFSICSYLNENNIDVLFAGIYKEQLSRNHTMGVFYGKVLKK